MRLSDPELRREADGLVLRANVNFDKGNWNFPDTLWFKYPYGFESLIAIRPEPFIVALSSVASALGEPIEASCAIPEGLHLGLEEYWSVFTTWAPKHFKPVDLRLSGYCAPFASRGETGTAFSGGVDSFFTLYRHSGEREVRPKYRIQWAVFVHGFDISLNDTETYVVAAQAYEEALNKLGVGLVRVTTNLRQFVDAANWGWSHGSALCGTAMTLSAGLGHFYIPSSKSYSTLEPWGSDPLTDPLLSSEGFQIIHDGASYTRFDKLGAMRDWKVIRPLLRTCWKHPNGLQNCGKCTKCRRTMMVLASLGILDQFETFPDVSSGLRFLGTSWETPHHRRFGRQAIAYARDHKQNGLAWIGKVAMATSLARIAWRRVGAGREAPQVSNPIVASAKPRSTLARGAPSLRKTYWALRQRFLVRWRPRSAKLIGVIHELPDPAAVSAESVVDPGLGLASIGAENAAMPWLRAGERQRLEFGSFRLSVPADPKRPIAQIWFSIAQQYPSFLNRALELEDRTAYLFDLLVKEDLRRHGLGRYMMGQAETAAMQMGAKSVFGWVECDNRAFEFLLSKLNYVRVADATRWIWKGHVFFWCTHLDKRGRRYLKRRRWISAGFVDR